MFFLVNLLLLVLQNSMIDVGKCYKLIDLFVGNFIALIKEESGFVIGGFNMSNIRYADDTTLIADTPQKLKK